MADTVSVLSFQLGVFAFLALICAGLYAAMRSESSLAWLVGALLFTSTLTVLLDLLPTSRMEVAVAIVAMPAAIFCIGEAVRLVLDAPRHKRFWKLVAGAAGFAMLMLYAGAPYLYIAILLKVTLAVALLEIVFLLIRQRPHHFLDWPLMAVLVAAAMLFVARVPLWLAEFSPETPYAEFLLAPFETTMLLSSGLLMAAVVVLLMFRGLSQMVIDLRFSTSRDVATGLLNREAFREQVALNRAAVGSVVFCDIDNFKQVNDSHGHSVGDHAIASFAKILSRNVPIAGRMGGDEFALYLPGETADEAFVQIERIRNRFASSRLRGADLRFTASFGIATYRRGECLARALQQADAALYEAKKKGRNQTRIGDGSVRIPANDTMVATG
ncbi:GGDEF domain-containing protein [Sphingomicrobium clamense]|uniref:diguanylate cyclase n=1 Tax=Sphingomicrobium clamense TaxID=2851013 RepID=A0ABS6V7R3_9SPHN|nr:GGDEF domain-containing protein [Sphingomicrobium sp. B8]MBW0145385.1 diguanylate cyclase [Sphingomicrobium sp. B8]